MHVRYILLDGAGTTASRLRKCAVILSLVVLATLTSTCQKFTPRSNPILPETYIIDPAFQEFYDQLGGLQVLGPAISPLFVYEEVNYQYTTSVLMVQNPHNAPDHRFYLAPLGLELGIAQASLDTPPQRENPSAGYSVAPPFVALYEQVGGERYAGRPISDLIHNPEKGRYEQHFENLGMYYLEGASNQEPALLAYGAWKCDSGCRHPKLGASTVVRLYYPDPVFTLTIEKLGVEFTGSAITEAYRTPQGDLEQVFANVVLVAPDGDPQGVFLRELTLSIGMQPEPPGPPNRDPQMFFYPLVEQGELGFNVPRRYLDYLILHGGREVSGPPIGSLKEVGELKFQQCFTNLCLQEERTPSGESNLRPMQLGYTYKVKLYPGDSTPDPERPSPPLPPTNPAPAIVTPPLDNPAETQAVMEITPTRQEPELTVQVWESYPLVNPGQAQEIGASVFRNERPLQGEEPELTVYMPDGSRRVYIMPPTGSEGQTRLLIEPIEAANGTLILYQVCVPNPASVKFCVKDNFPIWQSP